MAAAAAGAGRAEVERARSVAGVADLRKGHMALDCRRTVSMVALGGATSKKDVVSVKARRYMRNTKLLVENQNFV